MHLLNFNNNVLSSIQLAAELSARFKRPEAHLLIDAHLKALHSTAMAKLFYVEIYTLVEKL